MRWSVLVVLALGCGDDDAGSGGGRDAAVVDTVRADADPSCKQWARVEVPVVDVTMVEAMPIHMARSARFLVDVRQCAEDLPAPARSGFPLLTAPSVYLSMSVWRRQACTNPVIVRRPVTIVGFQEGEWFFDLENGTQKKVTAVAAPTPSCNTAQTDCDEDCDCAEGVCLSTSGLGGPFARCAVPCEVDRDCLGNGVCLTNVADELTHVCQTGSPECTGGDCPEGFSCTSGTCTPTFVLNSGTRHGCTCDSECDEGLHCAFHYGKPTGRCEALCQSSTDGWCEGPHVCKGSIEDVDDVCGWIGD